MLKLLHTNFFIFTNLTILLSSLMIDGKVPPRTIMIYFLFHSKFKECRYPMRDINH